MSLRVAFDLDGTLADMMSVLQAEAEKLFGTMPAAAPPNGDDTSGTEESVTEPSASITQLTLDSQQRTRLWRHIETIPNFWMRLPEIEPGIVRRLATVARDRRWEVIFLTTRPAVTGLTTQIQTQQWLEAHGFRWPSVFVVERSRGRVADALQLDAVVDDRSENCLDVALESKAAAIWVERRGEKHSLTAAKRLGVHVVPSTAAALTLLQKVDDSRDGSGVMRTLRRLFRE